MQPEPDRQPGPPPAEQPGQGGPPSYGPLPGYAPTPGYSPPAYGQPVYGQPPYAPSGYGQPPYGQPGYGVPYGYAPAPWNQPLSSARWPHGPGRPSVATAAAVLGFVTAGLTLLAQIFFVMALSRGGDATFGVLLLGIPCAIGMIVGAVRLLGRCTHLVLLSWAVAAVVVLILTFLVGLGTESGTRGGVLALLLFLVPASVLPITTAALTAQRRVSGWMNALP